MTKKTKITYWAFAGVFSVCMMMASIPDVLCTPGTMAMFQHFGHPAFLLPFICLAKLLGIVAVSIPGFP